MSCRFYGALHNSHPSSLEFSGGWLNSDGPKVNGDGANVSVFQSACIFRGSQENTMVTYILSRGSKILLCLDYEDYFCY